MIASPTASPRACRPRSTRSTCRGRSASSARARSTASPGPRRRSGEESAAAHDDDLDAYLHLAMCNRGILMTPFHNMALMCPDTTRADVDRHTATFREVVGALYA